MAQMLSLWVIHTALTQDDADLWAHDPQDSASCNVASGRKRSRSDVSGSGVYLHARSHLAHVGRSGRAWSSGSRASPLYD